MLVHCSFIERETDFVQLEEWICGDEGETPHFKS